MITKDFILQHLKNTLTETNFTNLGEKYQGKVRDNYIQKTRRILIATDRQSAFDRVLAAIPFKGQVLNQLSAWWFEKTKNIVENHIIEIPDPNAAIAKPLKIIPIEIVVRGYLTGVTDTSAWKNYEKGVRNFCGNILPDGMIKNQKFAQPIITPTTKSKGHDEQTSAETMIKAGVITSEKWNKIADFALMLFKRGTELAAEGGFMLVDTKYEFGEDEKGNIVLADEIHTPDSSRFWIKETYEKRFASGEEPENFDKEFLRLWFVRHCDPYKDKTLPEAPNDLVAELSYRYIQSYEKLTGEEFKPEINEPILERIEKNLGKYRI